MHRQPAIIISQLSNAAHIDSHKCRNRTVDSLFKKRWLTWMAWIIPIWAAPLAPPPPRTSPTDSPVRRRARREKSEWMFLSPDDLSMGSLAWNRNPNSNWIETFLSAELSNFFLIPMLFRCLRVSRTANLARLTLSLLTAKCYTDNFGAGFNYLLEEHWTKWKPPPRYFGRIHSLEEEGRGGGIKLLRKWTVLWGCPVLDDNVGKQMSKCGRSEIQLLWSCIMHRHAWANSRNSFKWNECNNIHLTLFKSSELAAAGVYNQFGKWKPYVSWDSNSELN